MKRVDRYAVIGNPIAHSKSPEIHAAFAAQTGEAIEYKALLAPIDKFAQTVSEFVDQGGRGLNVTVPFKLEAYILANKLSDRAKAAGAVNTLSVENDQLCGDNTDGAGLLRDLTQNLGCAIQGKKILLLGAGGAARGALLPLLEAHPDQLHIANRSIDKAHSLATEFGAYPSISISDLANIPSAYDIVINATAASLNNAALGISNKIFAPGCFAYDMMYGKQPTPFMQHAQQAGCLHIADGLGMLVEQAAESFYIWRGVRPQTAPVLTQLRASLTES